MPQITAGQTGTETLRAGSVLAVTLLAGAGCTVARSIGGAEFIGEAAMSASTTYGPYENDQTFRLCPFAGSTIDFRVQASPGAMLNDQQAAAAQAFASGDWTGQVIPDFKVKFTLRGTPYASVWVGSDSVLGAYTRSGVSSIHDHDGFMHIIRADELGYEGLRRVENLCPDARNFTNGWTVEASTTRTYIGGSATANQGVNLSRATASTTMITMNSATYEQDLHACRFDAWADSGTVVLRVKCERSSDSAVAGTKDITVSTTRFARAFNFTPLDGTAHRITVGIVSGGLSFNLDKFMVQRKVNRVTHPDDFVTRGESGAAWPYQGAGVDGVQYFDYLNPCFLESDGNVHELADRRYISESVFKGVRRFPGATQRLLQTTDLTNAAGGKTNVGTVTLATSVPNPIGRNRWYFVPETAVTGAFELYQDWSGTLPADGAPIPNAWYVGRGPTGGRKWCRVFTRLKDGATARSAYFDLERGVWGAVDTGIDPSDLFAQACAGGTWRIGFTVQAGTGATAPRFGIGPAPDDGVSSYAGTAGLGIYVGAPMATEADHVTAYVGHTAGSVITRGDGTIEVPITSNVPANDFTFHLDFTPMGASTDSKLKTGFHYIAYSYFDSSNRWGTALRPGVAGGNAGDRDAAGWAQDYYPNTVGFDGVQVRLGLVGQRGQTIKQFFGQASVARNGIGGGSFMTVGGFKGYSTTTAFGSVAPIANKQSYIRLGSSLITGKHDACYKNLVIWHRALSDAEMANGGSYR